MKHQTYSINTLAEGDVRGGESSRVTTAPNMVVVACVFTAATDVGTTAAGKCWKNAPPNVT